jgi:flagellar biosynthesis chaperone FliJ
MKNALTFGLALSVIISFYFLLQIFEKDNQIEKLKTKLNHSEIGIEHYKEKLKMCEDDYLEFQHEVINNIK